jgi:hypothetical protein
MLDKSAAAKAANQQDNHDNPNPPPATASEEAVKFGIYQLAHLQKLIPRTLFYAKDFFREYSSIIKNTVPDGEYFTLKCIYREEFPVYSSITTVGLTVIGIGYFP